MLCVKAAHPVVERVRDDPDAADDLGGAQRHFQREMQEIGGQSPALIASIDGELSEQRDGQRIGAIAPLRLGEKGALDLRGAQSDIAGNPSRGRIGDHIDARCAAHMIDPRMTAKPAVERRPPAIEKRAVIFFGERTRRRDGRVQLSQDGLRRASSASAGLVSAGRFTQASNASQSLAAIVMTLRASTSVSAASTAFRRMKSLSEVRDSSAAASSSARSSGVTRTLSTELACVGPVMCMTIAYSGANFNGPLGLLRRGIKLRGDPRPRLVLPCGSLLI